MWSLSLLVKVFRRFGIVKVFSVVVCIGVFFLGVCGE